ncbi:hypothetical protein [Petralouisia muris]|uniref:hypothetical protein n=1 Tax=Petralouisia muris TaxID=3032872 RepID=UPI00144135FC|nr:hypothetical protein [Petralouisia muris]
MNEEKITIMVFEKTESHDEYLKAVEQYQRLNKTKGMNGYYEKKRTLPANQAV